MYLVGGICNTRRKYKLFCFVFAADWNLEIDPVGIADDGKYQCQVTPQRSRDAYVNVHVPPEDPFIEDGPVLHVKESVEVKLECVARGGKPPAKVSITHIDIFATYLLQSHHNFEVERGTY